MSDTNFKKNIENFVCEKCGREVKGDGYTNHCPECLWSKHVDVNPGDRLADCGGMMEPVSVENKNGTQVLKHKCLKCGYEKNNKVQEDDDFDQLIKISSK